MPILRITQEAVINNVEIVSEGLVVGRGHFEIDMEPQRPGDTQSVRFVVTEVQNNRAGTAALSTDQLGNVEVVHERARP